MLNRCLHTLENGQSCNAPAVNGSKFCRHHDPDRPHQPAQAKAREFEPLTIPSLESKPCILEAVEQVALALGEGRIKRSVAQTLLSAFKLAARLLTEIEESGLSLGNEISEPAQPERIFRPAPASSTQPSRDRDRDEDAAPRPALRRPSNEALARLAASGNQKAAQFLAAIGYQPGKPKQRPGGSRPTSRSTASSLQADL